jgi:heme-degrading monooxygenase HmoA
MVLEIADFRVKAGTEDAFAAAVREGLALIGQTPGFLGARLTRSIESPSRFVLLIEWETVEAHTVGFRESDRFPRWRALIGPFFDGDPHVEHASDVPTDVPTDVLRSS